MGNLSMRQIGAAIAALVGGYLLYLSANPDSDFTTTLVTFWAGVILLGVIAWVLSRSYQPGDETPSQDEVPVKEWRIARFLRFGKEAAPLYLGVRVFLAYEWITASMHKLQDPGWVSTGTALQAYWQRAAAIPAQGSAPITYPAYRSFIQFMLDNQWYVWFGKIIAVGELLIGLGILLGGLIGFAAFFALLMNFSFLFAGSTSSNPLLILFEVGLLFGWRVAGWWGVDHYLLPRVGTPWSQQGPAPQSTQPTAPTPVAPT
jgi:thiosulfate dehydrogenase [quinone] large subunit